MTSPASASLTRDTLLRYLDETLEGQVGRDYCPNGLQVEGRATIRRLVTGVSACQELFERAIEQRADAILVHHGLFWDGQPPVITGIMAKRVRALIEAEISLFAYHLPLDRHAVYGNNVLAAQAFGLDDLEPFGEALGFLIGYRGRFAEPIAAAELVRRCETIYQQPPLVFDAGPDPVRTLGIISGGSQSFVHEAIAAGLDAFITGEATEWVMNVARENGIHYLAAGHYATERIGVQTLGAHLAEHFGINVAFVDVPNPV